MAHIFKTAPNDLRASFACFLVGLILYIIGFATTSWSVNEALSASTHNGLWQVTVCAGDSCTTRSYRDPNGYHRTIQAMEVLALIAFVVAFIALGLYLGADEFRRPGALKLSTALCIVGVILAYIGIAMFGSSDDHFKGKLGWSEVIALIGAAMYVIAGIVLIKYLKG